MALERRNPVPVGRYWIDVQNSKTDEFNGFLASHSKSIHTDTTEGDSSEEGGTTFYIFKVLTPVTWLPVNFGFPTIAGPEVKSKSDTVQRPDLPKNPLDDLDDTLSKLGSVAKIGLGILGLGLLAKYLGSNK